MEKIYSISKTFLFCRLAIVPNTAATVWPTTAYISSEWVLSNFRALNPLVEISNFSYYNHKPAVVANRTFAMFVHFATETKGGTVALAHEAWTLHHVDKTHYYDISTYAKYRAIGDYKQIVSLQKAKHVISERFRLTLAENIAHVINEIIDNGQYRSYYTGH